MNGVGDEVDVPQTVTRVLTAAVKCGASDVHFDPAADSLHIRMRVDGLLQDVERLDSAAGRGVVARLMVLSRLLTYRLDVPQEGKFSLAVDDAGLLDLRLSIMPTTHGLRAVIRLPAELRGKLSLPSLGLPARTLAGLMKFAAGDSGMLIVTGPAGAGKTTTIHALLLHIVQTWPGLSVVALEDPVERDVPGVTQIEVSPFGQLTYERALRSILRQDPQVLMLGEIRDAATASLAIQAALSGHRLVTTLHAAAAASAITRLVEMGIEPYQITSALMAVMSQRLLRHCSGGGYQGRVAVAEWVDMDAALRKAVLANADADGLAKAYSAQVGYQSLRQSAEEILRQGITDQAEVVRVLVQHLKFEISNRKSVI